MSLTSTASTPVNCSSSTSASCCYSSQLFDNTAGAASRPTGSSSIRARSAGSGGGAASCAVGAVGCAAGCAAGTPNGAARVGGGARVAVFPRSGPESSEEPWRGGTSTRRVRRGGGARGGGDGSLGLQLPTEPHLWPTRLHAAPPAACASRGAPWRRPAPSIISGFCTTEDPFIY